MARAVFPLLFCLFLLLGGREPPWGDANVSYATTKSLWDKHRLDIDLDAPPYFFTIHQGKKYGIVPLGNVVAMVPSWLINKRLAKLPKLQELPVTALATHVMPALFMAAAGALFLRLVRRRGAGPRLALVLTFGLALTTICFVYARVSYSEALQTFAMLAVVDLTLTQGERLTLPGMALLGLAAGVLLNSKVVYALVLPLFVAYLLWMHLHDPARRSWKRLAAGCAVALAMFAPFLVAAMWHNTIKTGTPFRSGHEAQGDFFGGDLGAALFGLLLSPGKSIFLYSPPLLLSVLGLRTALRRQRASSLLLLGVFLTSLLLHAKFRIWHGGYCWGPRYLVPVTPLLFALAVPWLPEVLARGRGWLRRTAVGVVLAAGLFVQVLGGSFYWDHYIRIVVAVRDQTGLSRWSEDHLPYAYFVPEFSPVLGHWWLLKHLWRNDSDLNRDAPWRQLMIGRLRFADNWSELRFDWWGRDWLRGKREYVRVGRIVLAGLGVGLLLSGYWLRRRLRREEAAARAAAAPAAPAAAPPDAAAPSEEAGGGAG